MVGDRLLDDRRRRARRIGCDSVRRDRFLARAGRYPCPLRRSGTRTVKREYDRTVRRELAVAYGRAWGAGHHPDYSLPAGGESGGGDGLVRRRVGRTAGRGGGRRGTPERPQLALQTSGNRGNDRRTEKRVRTLLLRQTAIEYRSHRRKSTRRMTVAEQTNDHCPRQRTVLGEGPDGSRRSRGQPVPH